MQPEQQHLSQADFARHMGVSRAAVSQWKKKDILRDNAFTSPEKKGKVVVSVAVDQVRRNRDIGQALGNGIETRTSTDAAPNVGRPEDALAEETEPTQQALSAVPTDQPDTVPPEPKRDTVEDQLKRARLEEQHRKNRMGAAEEARQQGKLMSSEDAREQMARVAVMMLQIFEGSLTDFAASIASQFTVPQRDVLHLLKSEFRQVRQSATQKERARLASLERNTTTSVELDG
ncbi:helix-turn-helix transcriptional regulator [Yoonia sp. I 8.24]|uniref:helix-turn-helix domain-containing protein n=1 Tax=Yoonia sp. I 8.24 TaxID=1537229 RepID=UPI001EDF3FFE|nr:helix-turn-helix transcriptional regulator [Yoonia sp. I 8.24]MCG3266101.1 helix-turn-helix transcriptional regulator [Yoonia sp. I 8.24]